MKILALFIVRAIAVLASSTIIAFPIWWIGHVSYPIAFVSLLLIEIGIDIYRIELHLHNKHNW